MLLSGQTVGQSEHVIELELLYNIYYVLERSRGADNGFCPHYIAHSHTHTTKAREINFSLTAMQIIYMRFEKEHYRLKCLGHCLPTECAPLYSYIYGALLGKPKEYILPRSTHTISFSGAQRRHAKYLATYSAEVLYMGVFV